MINYQRDKLLKYFCNLNQDFPYVNLCERHHFYVYAQAHLTGIITLYKICCSVQDIT